MIVENYNFLRKEGETDPEGRPVAIVKIKNVRPFMASDLLASCWSKWEPNLYAWEITDVRPLVSNQQVLAARGIYEVELSDEKIRLAKNEDIDQLTKLRSLMQQEVNEISESKVTDEYLNTVKQYFKESLANKSYVSSVAVVDGKIVAAAGVVFYQKPPSLPSGTGLVGYVTNVYTLPEFRKQGLASKLIELLVSEAKKRKVTKLHLGSTDDGKTIYERLGFKAVRFSALELNL